MKKVALVTFMLVSSLILGSSLIFAQNEDENLGKMPFFHGRIAEEIGLTEKQKAQIKQVYQMQKGKTQALKQEMRQIRRQLSEQGRDGVFDEALVTELANRQAELTKQMIIEQARTKASIFAILTPEQREKFQQLNPQKTARFFGGKRLNFREKLRERVEAHRQTKNQE